MKNLTRVSPASLSTQPVTQAVVLDGTKISFIGPSGLISQIDLKEAMIGIITDALVSSYTNKLSTLVADGSPSRLNPTVPKLGDIQIIKPILAPNGNIQSGSYQVKMYLQSGWKNIFP